MNVYAIFHTRTCLRNTNSNLESNVNYKLPREIFMLEIRYLAIITIFSKKCHCGRHRL